MEDVVTCLNYWMVLTMGTLALRLLMARWTRWYGKLDRFGANPARVAVRRRFLRACSFPRWLSCQNSSRSWSQIDLLRTPSATQR
jgi:hypothetical protein